MSLDIVIMFVILEMLHIIFRLWLEQTMWVSVCGLFYFGRWKQK